MGQVARNSSNCRYAGVIHRLAADDAIGALLSCGEESRRFLEIVLAVGIDLQRMGVALAQGGPQPGRHGGALSNIGGKNRETNLARLGRKRAKRRSLRRATSVIDKENPKAMSKQTPDGPCTGFAVVVAWHDEAWPERCRHGAWARRIPAALGLPDASR